MKNDYLWDRTGEPDREIERLEKALAPLRHRGEAPELEEVSFPPQRPSLGRWRIAAAIAAAAIGGLLAWGVVAAHSWQLVRPGEPGPERIAAGDRIETGSIGALLRMRFLGEIEIGPGTSLRIERAAIPGARIDLIEGAIHARISAPPRLFVTSTGAGEAIDLGCAYTLSTLASGEGTIEVTLGWVAFQGLDRVIYLPAGTGARTYEGRTGTPVRTAAPETFHDAVAAVDFGTAEARAGAIGVALGEASKKDAITLWHMLRDAAPRERERIASRIAAIVELPKGVELRDLAAGDEKAIARLGASLGVRPTRWWSSWARSAFSRLLAGTLTARGLAAAIPLVPSL
ncbi:MAG TPA: hypothetical protein VMS56_10650 [Thermoanaerobaculia bacterium]|nr:hypothetical protein [Thermoanaerobaculia bacterium]